MSLQLTDGDWQKITDRVQATLRALDAAVAHDGCTLDIVGQRSVGGPDREFHYIYRSYSCREMPECESVVVGVNVTTQSDYFTLEGDIGGEETGHTYFESPEMKIEADFDNLLNAAENIAKQLAQKDGVLRNAIAEHRPAPDILHQSK